VIIFLNGSINSGKTTVAEILAKKLSSVAIVEIDALRAMINWMPIDQAIPINLENAVSVIRNFSKRGLDVIIPYPLSQKNYEYVADNLKDIDTQKYFFTLAPSLEKAITNRGTRELDDQEKKRIAYHYDIGIHSPSFGEIIDNSDQTPEETARIILAKIK
jgi:type III secretion system FlhB-like substrate exporter